MATDQSIAQIQTMLAQTEPKIAEAERFISLMKSAGENTMAQEQKLSSLKMRVNQWKQALVSQGVQ